MKKELKRTFIQIVKFGIVGLSNTAVTAAALFILIGPLKVDPLVANPIGYALGLINSFIFNKLWTFKSSSHPLKEGLLFLLVFAVSFTPQFALYKYMLSIGYSELISNAVGMVVYTGINFIGNRLFTFKQPAIEGEG